MGDVRHAYEGLVARPEHKRQLARDSSKGIKILKWILTKQDMTM
jgi:hypothetical protein